MNNSTCTINDLRNTQSWNSSEILHLSHNPFEIITFQDTDIPNIKFDKKKNPLDKLLFETICNDLKENKWKYIPTTDVWIPTKPNSTDFAYELKKKYSISSEIDEQYKNVLFFDRNYEEIEEFTKFFNEHKNTLTNVYGEVQDITNEEAWSILSALNHDNNSINPEQRNYRLGVDKNDLSQLIIVEKRDGTYLQRPVNLESLLEKAYLNTIENKRDAQKVIKQQTYAVSDELNSLFSDIWIACREKTSDSYKEVGKLYSRYTGRNTVPVTKPLTLQLGDSINDEKINSLNYITDNIYQIETEKSLFPVFAIDKSISLQCDEALMKKTVDYGDFVIIENKAAEPYIVYELITKGLMPSHTEEFFNKLSNFIEQYPAKYIDLYPITADNFLSSFSKYVDIENNKDKSVLELASELIKLVEPQEKAKLDKVLKIKGVTSPLKLKEVLNFELEKHNLKKNNLTTTDKNIENKRKSVYER